MFAGYDSFYMLFPEAPASYGKRILKSLLMYFTSICINLKIVPQIFKILFQTGIINIFVLHSVFFSRSAQLKSSFSDEKTSVVKSETHFRKKLSKFNVAKY